MVYNVHADCDWIQGHLRWGHYEGQLDEEAYQEYLKLDNDKDRATFICENCDLIVDDWEVNDCDDPTNIRITKSEY